MRDFGVIRDLLISFNMTHNSLGNDKMPVLNKFRHAVPAAMKPTNSSSIYFVFRSILRRCRDNRLSRHRTFRATVKAKGENFLVRYFLYANFARTEMKSTYTQAPRIRVRFAIDGVQLWARFEPYTFLILTVIVRRKSASGMIVAQITIEMRHIALQTISADFHATPQRRKFSVTDNEC